VFALEGVSFLMLPLGRILVFFFFFFFFFFFPHLLSFSLLASQFVEWI
jgi:hypothetical protein